MAIKIDETDMEAISSGASAKQAGKGWRVSYLPGREVDRNQAVTAMVLSEAVASNPPEGHKDWLFIDRWAEELSLSRAEAVSMIRQPRKDGREPEAGS
jgi:hypothetical protein